MPKSRLTREYLTTLQQRAVEDADLAAAFIRVTSLIDPPDTLLRPEIMERAGAAAWISR